MAPGDDLTPDERARIAPYVTDPVGPVFALTHLPEAVKGALFARYSRSANSVRRILLDEFIPDGDQGGIGSEVGADRAREFFQRVLADYGDDSVAQLGGAHVAIEGVSNVLTKVIEWGRLASYLEQSTRYVPYDTQVDGRWKYVRPPGIAADPALLARYEAVLDDAFATYARLNTVVFDHLMATEAPDPDDAAAMRALRARALDAVRGLLPAATTANVGVYASGQAWESLVMRLRAHPLAEAREVGDQVLAALRHVIPDFLTRVDRPDRGERHGLYRRATEERAAQLAVPDTGGCLAPGRRCSFFSSIPMVRRGCLPMRCGRRRGFRSSRCVPRCSPSRPMSGRACSWSGLRGAAIGVSGPDVRSRPPSTCSRSPATTAPTATCSATGCSPSRRSPWAPRWDGSPPPTPRPQGSATSSRGCMRRRRRCGAN